MVKIGRGLDIQKLNPELALKLNTIIEVINNMDSVILEAPKYDIFILCSRIGFLNEIVDIESVTTYVREIDPEKTYSIPADKLLRTDDFGITLMLCDYEIADMNDELHSEIVQEIYNKENISEELYDAMNLLLRKTENGANIILNILAKPKHSGKLNDLLYIDEIIKLQEKV